MINHETRLREKYNNSFFYTQAAIALGKMSSHFLALKTKKKKYDLNLTYYTIKEAYSSVASNPCQTSIVCSSILVDQPVWQGPKFGFS